MLDRRQFFATTAAAAALSGTAARAQASGDANARSDAQLAAIAEAMLREYPETATSLGIDKAERAGLRSRLSGRSRAAREAQAAACAERLKALQAVDRSALSGQASTNHSAALFAHRLAHDGYRQFSFGDVYLLNSEVSYASSPYVVNPATTAFSNTPDLLENRHKVETAADGESYLARMEAFADNLDGETGRLREDVAGGMIPPDFTCDIVLGQLTGYRKTPVADWGIVTAIARQAAEKGLAGDWKARAEAIGRDKIGPALDRQIAAMQDARAKAASEPGIWRRDRGEDWYAWGLEASTTTKATAEEIHRVGLAQNEEISAEMDKILRAQGLTQGTVGERMTALGKDPKVLWPDTDQGRKDIIAYVESIIEDLRPRLPRAFSRLPDVKVDVKRVPPEIQAGMPNAYAGAGSIDGSRPGAYYINLRDMSVWPKFSLASLTYHEALPGHVLQGTFQNRLPLIMALLSFNAYSEGWGLYSEQLADELGVYENDPLGRLGYLQSINFRAARLVVDTGLHAKRWEREKAVQFMIKATGRPEAACRSEVDRYCVWPGQACGYKWGHNEVNRLRDRARSALGPRFDVRGFNDAVVESGNVPLPVLGEVVDRWTVSQKA